MRYSKQRDEVLNAVLNSTMHPTARMVYDDVKRIIPNISLGTVYRNLGTLVCDGLIKRIPIEDGNDRFDKTLENHNHIYCTCCGMVEDIASVILEENFKNIEDETGFKITDCNFNIKGICKNCIMERNC